MAKETKPYGISSTVTAGEGLVLEKLDTIITESRAEFIRRVVIKEARKIVNKSK